MDGNFEKIQARELPTPSISFARKNVSAFNGKFRSEEAVSSGINNWAYVCEREDNNVNQILENLRSASTKLGISLKKPVAIIVDKSKGWTNSLRDQKDKFEGLDIALVMLPSNGQQLYQEVKNVFLTKLKVPCQCLNIFKQKFRHSQNLQIEPLRMTAQRR